MPRKIPFFVLEQEIGLAAATQMLYFSTDGYRRRSTDAGGAIAYPARISEAFSLDASLDLDPATDQTAWASGVAKLANGHEGRFNALVNAGWTPDGHPARILWGEKTVEWQGGVLNSRGVAGATYINWDGFMYVSSGPTVVRQDYGAVISVDPASTNWLRNSTMVGAVVGVIGSGGAMPYNWVQSFPGLTVQVISVTQSTVAGGKGVVMRVRCFGTTSSTTGSFNMGFAGGLGGLALNQALAQSVYVALTGGSLTGVTQVRHWLQIADVANTIVVDNQPDFKAGITATLQLFQRTTSAPSSGSGPFRQGASAGIVFNWASGVALDFTLDIAAPQIEYGTVATPFIPTVASAAGAVGEISRGPGTTNMIRNASTTGAVTGTPGTLPTNWLVNSASGLSTQVVAISTDAQTGYPYIDFRVFGTSTGTFFVMSFDGAAVIDTAPGQLWTLSVYAFFVSGSQTGITFQVHHRYNVGGTILETAGALPTAGAPKSRRVISGTAPAGSGFIQPSLVLNFASGAAIDCTFRLFAPQLEGGLGPPSAWVSTTGSRVTRNPTFTSNGLSPPVINEPAATQYVQTNSVWAGSGEATITTTTEVPALMAGRAVSKHVRTATGSSFGFFDIPTMPSTGITVRGSIYVWVPLSFGSGRTADVRLEGSSVVSGGSQPGARAIDLTKRGQWQRVSLTATILPTFADIHITPRIFGSIAPGDMIYTTCPQIEVDTGPATSYIQPLGTSPTTRTADNIYRPRFIAIDPPYASLQPVLTAVAGPWELNEDTLTIPIRDASYWLEKNVSRNTYGGTGGYDGNGAVNAVMKPLALGGNITNGRSVRNVTPLLIDDVALVYQVSDGYGSTADIFEGGYDGFTFDSDTTNLFSGTVAPGRWRRDASHGCFQLGSPPVGQITADVFGAQQTGGATDGRVDVLAYYILTAILGVPTSFVSDVPPGTGLHAVAVIDPTATVAAESPAGLFLASGQDWSGTQLMSALLANYGLWLVPLRNGTLAAYHLAALTGSETPVASLGVNNARINRLKLPASLDPPWKRARVVYDHNWTVQTSGLLAATSAFRKQYVAGQGAIVEKPSPIAANILRPADPTPIGMSMMNTPILPPSTGPGKVATTFAALFGNRRGLWQVDVPYTIGMALDWGSVVRLQFPIGDLAAGKLGQVVGFTRTSQPTQSLRVLT